MPLPMVHFLVAVEMHKLDDRHPSPPFVLGSIAPDAIHARPNTDRSHKNRTHLLTKPHSQTTDDEYWELVHAFLHRHWPKNEHIDFIEGYAAHVMADRLWLDGLFRPFRAKVNHLAQEELARLYYREADQVDVFLYRRMVWRPQLWQSLAAATAVAADELVSAQEVDAWRQRTLRWYDDPQNDPQIEPDYITYEAVVDFAVQAAQTIRERLTEWKNERG
ncbi:MAG: hypothetical protein R3A44_40875 [Caldilineaceae bacterium]